MNYLIVFVGAGVGGALRHGVNAIAARAGWIEFPTSTIVVNVIGSFLMGVIAEYFALRSHLPLSWRLFLTTGMLGGFTTFSTFSLESALLYERGRLLQAALYIALSVAGSVAALFLAMALIRALVRT
jgi:CrcB protein